MMFIRISEAIAFLFEIIYLIWIRSEEKRAISVQQRVIHHCAMCSRFCLIVFFFFFSFSFLRTWVKRLESYSLMCSMVHRWKLNPGLDTQIRNYGEKYFFFPRKYISVLLTSRKYFSRWFWCRLDISRQ